MFDSLLTSFIQIRRPATGRRFFIASVLFLLGVSSGFFPGLSLAAGLENQGSISLFGATMPGLDTTSLPEVSKSNGGVEIKLRSQYEFNRSWKLRFQPWFLSDGLTKTIEEKNQFEVDELSLEWKKSSRKIKAGISTVNWEGTDFLNPMDIVSAKNWRDPFNSRQRGAAGLFYSDQWAHISWDAVYLPKQSKALFPGRNSPWLPRQYNLPLERDDTQLLLPTPVEYDFNDETILNHALDNNAALRLQYHGDGWDFSLAGAEGSASPPLLFPTLTGTVVALPPPKTIVQLQSPVTIETVYYRQRTASTALVATAGSWIFRLAAQHTQTLSDDPRLPTWSDFGVFGIEKSISWKDQTASLLFQVAASHKPESGSISVVSSLLERAVMLGWRWPLSEKFTWTSAFFQEQKFKSHFIHSEFSYALNDQWALNAAADILSGSQESVLGIYDRNDRYIIRTIYSF